MGWMWEDQKNHSPPVNKSFFFLLPELSKVQNKTKTKQKSALRTEIPSSIFSLLVCNRNSEPNEKHKMCPQVMYIPQMSGKTHTTENIHQRNISQKRVNQLYWITNVD